MGIFVLGLVFLGVGLAFYFSYESTDEKQMAMIKCTVKEVREYPDGLEVTVAYEYNGKTYSKTKRSEVFRDVGFQKGREMDLMINVSNPQEAMLVALKPRVQASGLRYAGAGLVLIVISILLWRWMVARGPR